MMHKTWTTTKFKILQST